MKTDNHMASGSFVTRHASWYATRESWPSLAATFTIGILAYFVFISQHLLHNHTLRLPWVIENDQLWAGRWFNLLLMKLNYDADIPVLMPIFSITLGVWSSFLLLRIWKSDIGSLSQTAVMASVLTFPAVLSFFYFSYQTPLFFSAWFFAVHAVCLARDKGWIALGLASLSIMLVLASYQTVLSVFTTVAICSAIYDLLNAEQAQVARFRICIVNLLRSGVAMIAGLILYWMSLKILEIDPPGSTQITALPELLNRVFSVAKVSFSHLMLSQPELLSPIKTGLAGILILAIAICTWHLRKTPLLLLGSLLLWALAVVATKAIFVLVAPDGSTFDYRYNSSLGFLHAFSFWIVLRYSGRLSPIAILLVAFFVLRFVQADLVRQEVLLRGQQHDLALANRILMRIETLPDIDTSKTYDLVRIGRYGNYRQSLLKSKGRTYDRIGDGHMDVGEISDRWVDEEVFRLLGSSVKFRFQLTDPEFNKKISIARSELLEGRKPWPSDESVFISADTIYIYMR